MDLKKFKDYLSKQSLIIYYLNQKLSVVNYIVNGYIEDQPILTNNSFLHFTAHVYYRSIIIDLYALFGPAKPNNKNAFRHLIDYQLSYINHIDIGKIYELIVSVSDKVHIIKNLRDKEMAHYDFETKNNLSFNFDYLETVNELFSLSIEILHKFGAAFIDENNRTDFTLESDEYVVSLQRLLEKQ